MRSVNCKAVAVMTACVIALAVSGCQKRPRKPAPGSALATPGPKPPALKIVTTPNPARGAAPLDVTIDVCTSSDPEGDVLSFSFDFGDGAKKSNDYCRQGHLYVRSGTYTGRVCASDGITSVCEPFTVQAS
jgi:hypothetical protein